MTLRPFLLLLAVTLSTAAATSDPNPLTSQPSRSPTSVETADTTAKTTPEPKHTSKATPETTPKPVAQNVTAAPVEEKFNASEIGLWAIEDPSVHYDTHTHHHAPYCLLLQMKASLVVPTKDWKSSKAKSSRKVDDRDRSDSSEEEDYGEDDDEDDDDEMEDLLDDDDGGVVKNRTIEIPTTAVASGTCTDTQQTITLSWNNTADSGKLVKTGHIVFIFEKGENNSTALAGVFSTISLFLNKSGAQNVIDGGAPTQHLDMKTRDVDLWLTPNRFAFVCRTRSEIRLTANTNPVEGGSDDSYLVDPIENDEAFLVADFIRVQAFRGNNGFTKHFTHLQYDCTRNWPYGYVPWAVGLALLGLVVFNIVMFSLRKKMGCTPSYDDEEDSSPIVVSTAISEENSGRNDEKNLEAL